MEIEFSLIEADIITLTRYRLKQLPPRRNPIVRRRIAYTVGFLLLAAGSWMLTGIWVLPFLFFIAAVLSILFYPTFFDWLLRYNVMNAYRQEKMRATLGSRTMIITDSSLEERTSWGQSQIKWDVIDKILVTPLFTLLSIQESFSVIIPKKRVISGDYDSFVEACRQHMNKYVA